MEPPATGHSERTFSYVVRAPSSDGFDVMNVDLKIDTAWIFRDAEDSDEEQGCLPEAAAGTSPDVDTGMLRKQLESSEQKLLAAVDKYVRSESGLRSRIQELELSERRLLQKVDQLRARVCQEQSASLRAQEQLEVLQGELASQVLEKERAARRQRWRLRRLREQLRYKDEALGQQTAALERCRRTQRRQLGLARQQERVLREQVRRLERDVRRLCRAAGLLLAELDAPVPGSRRPLGPAGPQAAPEEAAAWRGLQARAELSESKRDEAPHQQQEQRKQREQRSRERSLQGQLEELRCYIFELKLSEISLQGQVEDLIEQNRCLREELGAQGPGETVRSVTAAGPCSLVSGGTPGQESEGPGASTPAADPVAQQGGAAGNAQEWGLRFTRCVTLEAPSCIQDEWLCLPWEEALGACRHPGRQTSPHPSGAPGPERSAGQPVDGPHTWGCTGAGGGPSVLVSGLETPAGLLGDLVGPALGQPAPVEPSWHEQTLLLIGGCHPEGLCLAGPLLPVELAWIPEQRPATAPAREPCLMLQMPTTPPWKPAGDRAALLLQGAAPGQLETQQVLDARPPLAPRAIGQPCWQHHQTRSCDTALCQESPPMSHHRCPRTGPRNLNALWKERGGAPEWRPEEQGARKTWGRKDKDLGNGCQQHQDSHEQPSVEGGTRGLEGLRSPPRATAPQAAASHLWPRREPHLPLLQGGSPKSTEGPKSPGGRWEAEERVWGLLGGLSLAEEEGEPPATSVRAPGAEGPSSVGARLLEEEVGGTRSTWGQEERRAWAGDALFLLRESPGGEGQGEVDNVLCPAGSSPGCMKLPGEPSSEEWEAMEMLCFGEEGSLPLSPRWALSPEEAEPTRPPRVPRKGPGSSVPTLDAFAEEMEACFQQLSVLKLGTGGWGWEASMLAGGDGDQELADPWQVLASQGLVTCPVKEGDAKESHGDIKLGEALGASQVLPELELDSEDLCSGPEGPPELGQPLCEPSAALDRARRSLHQLISGLKEERSKVLHDNIKLWRDQERCHHKIRALQRERERNVNKISTLARENGALLGDICHLRRELDQYLQVISDLEDCNGKSYSKISELEEENGKLRGCLGRLRRAMSESARKCQGVVRDVTQENRDLKALISELGASYKGLIKDLVVGIEDMIRALRGENAHLLHRIQVLEREVAVSISADGGRLRGARGKSKLDTVERAVQATQLSELLAPGVHGPPLKEGQGLAAGWTGPTLGLVKAGCGAESAAPLPAGRNAGAPSAPQGGLGGAAVRGAHPEREEERPWQPADRGPARRSLRNSPQRISLTSDLLQDPEAAPSEEDPGLRTQQLRHQVLTLQCQLRDQGSAGRELLAARDEALRLRDQLQAKVEELQKKLHEASLAVTPLKAKLASLVQKCRDRNHLLTHLLRELRRHGAAEPLLSEMVRGMLDDVALAEYAATFLAPGLPETSCRLDIQPEETAAVRGRCCQFAEMGRFAELVAPVRKGPTGEAQKHLLNPETDSVFPRPVRSESGPLAEAVWPAQTAPPASLELPLPSGPTPHLGPYPAVATMTSGLPAQCLQGEGGRSHPALRADDPSPPSGLQGPARILALHRELHQSIRSSSRAHKSPLEL
ncbi:uncharacterized protein C4orf50 homolog [Sturnira hondurensis]|uniref:uncharacterized protein C4orf50 homolog n=1 Tax=Sturnira hondurensis TaxID=192404 RepID=UPI00187B0E23|nr:uncharacterized protein C4orf50 homolog [Sturnira hondurensis]